MCIRDRVSLAVADLDASLAFYRTLGFREVGGDGDWRILGNGTTKIGLFQGMFDANILTFNPGIDQHWAADAAAADADGVDLVPPSPKPDFTDVRVIEQRLRDAGVAVEVGTETDAGPGHVVVTDPDGNRIMFDQFF